jgi:hypothetical protein
MIAPAHILRPPQHSRPLAPRAHVPCQCDLCLELKGEPVFLLPTREAEDPLVDRGLLEPSCP